MLRLLSATDLLPKSEPALERAGVLADALHAELSMLHVVAPVESNRVLEQTLQMAIGWMKSRAQAPLWSHTTVPDVVVRAGSPARLILQAVSRLRPDLVVLGPHGSRGIRDALEGTIASKVLAKRVCPVLIVNTPPGGNYRRVMLALDESSASGAAIRTAESLVVNADVDAQVVHAFDPPYRGALYNAGASATAVARYSQGWMADATNRMRDLLKHHSSAFNRYEILIEEGRPAMGILQAVKLQRPDLLVMGTGARGCLHRAFLGSVANEVLLSSTCDVLVVPEDGPLAAVMSQPRAARGARSPLATRR